MDRFHPGRFGKVGMRHFHYTNNPHHKPIINTDRLWALVPEAQRQQAGKSDVVPVIDTLAAGYGKVLAKGVFPNKPCIVKARFFSRQAENKIKAAGGTCVLVA